MYSYQFERRCALLSVGIQTSHHFTEYQSSSLQILVQYLLKLFTHNFDRQSFTHFLRCSFRFSDEYYVIIFWDVNFSYSIGWVSWLEELLI